MTASSATTLRPRRWLRTLGSTACALVAIALLAAPAGAQNLLDNPGFDDGIDGWESSDTLTFLPNADELGSPDSGALQVVGRPGFTGALVEQCVPVVPGTTYAHGASARWLPGQTLVTPNAYVSVVYSSSPTCATLDLGGTATHSYTVSLTDAWGPAGSDSVAPPGAQAASFAMLAVVGEAPAQPLRVEFDNAFLVADTRCVQQSTSICLSGDRFRVQVLWKTKQGQQGYGHTVPLTGDSGYLWFFNDANVELVLKLLDACSTQFDRFWFFAAGLTNVETKIYVWDTVAKQQRVYLNPQETPFAPVQDTNAFETCP